MNIEERDRFLGLVPTLPVDKLVKLLVQLRELKSKATKEAGIIEANYKAIMEMCENRMLAEADKAGVEGFKTEHGTTYTAETSKVKGIVAHSHAHSNSPNGDLGTTGLKADSVMNVLRKGRIWAIAEDGCVPGDRLWVRCTAGSPAGTEFVGSLGNADEGTETIDCTAQGVWLSTASAGGVALLEVDFTNKP